MTETTIGTLPKINGFALRRPRLLPMLSFILLLSTLSLLFVWCRVQATSLDYEISSLEAAVRTAQQETAVLRLEVATLGTPQRLVCHAPCPVLGLRKRQHAFSSER